MKEVYIDKNKPLWWVILVIFCMVIIYSIGANSEHDKYNDDVNPHMVENQNGGH